MRWNSLQPAKLISDCKIHQNTLQKGKGDSRFKKRKDFPVTDAQYPIQYKFTRWNNHSISPQLVQVKWILLFSVSIGRTLTCTSVTSGYKDKERDQRERNIVSLTWVEQMRTSCRSRSRSGPLTLGARTMMSPWAGKVKVLSPFCGICWVEGAPDKPTQLNPLQLSRPSEVP